MPTPSTPVPSTGAIVRLARFVLAHRRLVLVLWILLLPAGIYGASHVSSRLKIDFSLPGQPGYETAKKITHLYGNGGDTSPAVVRVTLPAGQTVSGDRGQLATAFARTQNWNGGPAVLQSRAWDDAGNVQPTRAEIIAARGQGSRVAPVTAFISQHYNGPTSWAVDASGGVRAHPDQVRADLVDGEGHRS